MTIFDALTQRFIDVPDLGNILFSGDGLEPRLELGVAGDLLLQFAERRESRQLHEGARLRRRQPLHLGHVTQRQPLLTAQEVLELRVVRRVTVVIKGSRVNEKHFQWTGETSTVGKLEICTLPGRQFEVNSG